MIALNEYLKERNRVSRLFNGKELSYPRDRDKIIQMIESELSRENLTCYGELSRSAVIKRLRFLLAVQADLGVAL